MIADNLNYLMLQIGISVQELSVDTKIERSTLTKILNGSTGNPRIETIATLARYFNVRIEELLDNDYEHDLKIKLSGGSKRKLEDTLRSLMLINGINNISLLAKYTGISVSIISDILSGKTKKPHIDTLRGLANLFNISVSQLCGADPIPDYQTATITIARKVLPVIALDQVERWILGSLGQIDEYLQISCAIVGDRAFIVKIANNEFSPDFGNDHILVIDNGVQVRQFDFCVCRVQDSVSIYQCLELVDNKMALRKAGTVSGITVAISDIENFGVVVQQVLNRERSGH